MRRAVACRELHAPPERAPRRHVCRGEDSGLKSRKSQITQGGKRKLQEGATVSLALLSSSAPADSRWRGHHAGLAKVQVGGYPLVDTLSVGGVRRHKTPAWNSGIRLRALSLLTTGC